MRVSACADPGFPYECVPLTGAVIYAIDPDVIPIDLEIPIAAAPVGPALSCSAQSFRSLRLCAAREPARVGSARTGESALNALK
jgi:hypothetical protein